jgi:hypothetical protein
MKFLAVMELELAMPIRSGVYSRIMAIHRQGGAMKLLKNKLATLAEWKKPIRPVPWVHKLLNRPHRIPKLQFGPMQIASLAIASFAVGALAIGTVAVGSLAIGRLVIGRGRMKRLKIDRLEIDHLAVHDQKVGQVGGGN